MKIYISSFIVVTDDAINFIQECKSSGEDFLLVMTDGDNPIITADVREEWLINSSGFRTLPIETILHNEDSDGFDTAINELVDTKKSEDVIFETFHMPEDLAHLVFDNTEYFTIKNEVRGDLLDDIEVYLTASNGKWRARYWNRFMDIVSATQFGEESEDFGFILVTDTVREVEEENKRGVKVKKEVKDTLISLAKDIDRLSFFAPPTNVESFVNIPIFISILEENFGITIKDYHFRTFVEKGVSNRIVFLMTDDDEDTITTLLGDVVFEVDDYSDLVTISKGKAHIAGGIGSWASLMVDDIKLEESVKDE